MKLIYLLLTLAAFPVFAGDTVVTPPESPEAEVALGKAYYYGENRSADVGLAYFWFLVADSHGADTYPFMEMVVQGVETGGLSAEYIQRQVARYHVDRKVPGYADVRIPDAGSTYKPEPPPGLPPLVWTEMSEPVPEKKEKSTRRNATRSSVQGECKKDNAENYQAHIAFLRRRYQDITNRARVRELNGKAGLTDSGMQEIREINRQIEHYEDLERRAAENRC